MGAAAPSEGSRDMAAHLSIGRNLSISLAALVGLALVAVGVHFLIRPGPDVQTANREPRRSERPSSDHCAADDTEPRMAEADPDQER